MVEPPMSKHALAGRLRRLLATADRAARRTGIPTSAATVGTPGQALAETARDASAEGLLAVSVERARPRFGSTSVNIAGASENNEFGSHGQGLKLSEQLNDPVADGHAWAQRQESAFGEWVTRYGGGDPDRWDYGLDSVNTLSYLIFDHFPTTEAIDDPANAGFSDPAAWYLGEIIRRSDPKKLCWSRQDYGHDAGDYVVRPTAKTRAWETHNPRAHVRFTPTFGDPLWLPSYYAGYVAPLWDKPWPPWIFASETGAWSWDEAGQRWVSQRDQWLDNIAGLLGVLAAHLGDTALDYSTASLEAVEAFTVTSNDINDAAQVGALREAVIAYVGECLLRTGGAGGSGTSTPNT